MTYKENWSANDRIPYFVSWQNTVVKDKFVRNDTVEQETDEATLRN
jgi:hypothetical protein